MVAYALLKGSRLGMLYAQNAWLGAELLACTQQLQLFPEDEADTLHGVCTNAGLDPGPDNRSDRDGTVRYYLSERPGLNNPYGLRLP